jgi:Outer membrane protein and related peptidoglycan-associated (lipo)proteins
MKKLTGILFLLFTLGLALGIALAASDPNDVQGSSDPPLFTRMPGYFIESYENKDFDSAKLVIGADGKTMTVEGHYTYIRYETDDRAKSASAVQIRRNYANAAQKIGGKIIYQDDNRVTLKIAKNAAEVWAEIQTASDGNVYFLTVVAKDAMKQDVVADAASLANSLKDTGKVALYGIYFDTGKAIVKPESQPALQEIGKLLKSDPKLKLYVVGHTDNTGTLDANMKLSMDRAAAVVKVLVSQYGISAARLTACGDGPTAPAASNDTEEGRTQNRRVELVKQ